MAFVVNSGVSTVSTVFSLLTHSTLVTRLLFKVKKSSCTRFACWDTATIALWQAMKSQNLSDKTVLDYGTGELALLAIRASRLRASQVTAIDKDPIAVNSARQLCKNNHVHNISIIQADLTVGKFDQGFDLVVLNPPFVPSRVFARNKSAQSSRVVWDGGLDGLSAVRTFLAIAEQHLQPGGKVMLGISTAYSKTTVTDVLKIADTLGLRIVATKKPLFLPVAIMIFERSFA